MNQYSFYLLNLTKTILGKIIEVNTTEVKVNESQELEDKSYEQSQHPRTTLAATNSAAAGEGFAFPAKRGKTSDQLAPSESEIGSSGAGGGAGNADEFRSVSHFSGGSERFRRGELAEPLTV